MNCSYIVVASDVTRVLVESFGDLIMANMSTPADRVDISREERFVVQQLLIVIVIDWFECRYQKCRPCFDALREIARTIQPRIQVRRQRSISKTLTLFQTPGKVGSTLKALDKMIRRFA